MSLVTDTKSNVANPFSQNPGVQFAHLDGGMQGVHGPSLGHIAA